jgi:hypothetical protein
MASTSSVRSKMFCAREIDIMKEFMIENLSKIKSFSSGGPGNARRVADLWDQLTLRVNSVGNCCRSAKQVKEKWRNMVR